MQWACPAAQRARLAVEADCFWANVPLGIGIAYSAAPACGPGREARGAAGPPPGGRVSHVRVLVTYGDVTECRGLREITISSWKATGYLRK